MYNGSEGYMDGLMDSFRCLCNHPRGSRNTHNTNPEKAHISQDHVIPYNRKYSPSHHIDMHLPPEENIGKGKTLPWKEKGNNLYRYQLLDLTCCPGSIDIQTPRPVSV